MRPDARSRRSGASQAQGSEAAQRIAPGSPFVFAHLAGLHLRALHIQSPNQTGPTKRFNPSGSNRRKLTLDLVRETQAVQKLRKLTLYLDQLMQAGQCGTPRIGRDHSRQVLAGCGREGEEHAVLRRPVEIANSLRRAREGIFAESVSGRQRIRAGGRWARQMSRFSEAQA
jgi:hypothetical protein